MFDLQILCSAILSLLQHSLWRDSQEIQALRDEVQPRLEEVIRERKGPRRGVPKES